MKRKIGNRRLKHQMLFGKLDPQLAALWSNRDGSGSGNGYGDGSGYGDGTLDGNGYDEDDDIPRPAEQLVVWDTL